MTRHVRRYDDEVQAHVDRCLKRANIVTEDDPPAKVRAVLSSYRRACGRPLGAVDTPPNGRCLRVAPPCLLSVCFVLFQQ